MSRNPLIFMILVISAWVPNTVIADESAQCPPGQHHYSDALDPSGFCLPDKGEVGGHEPGAHDRAPIDIAPDLLLQKSGRQNSFTSQEEIDKLPTPFVYPDSKTKPEIADHGYTDPQMYETPEM